MVPYFRFPKEAPRLPTAEELAALHAWALIEDGAPSYAGCPAIVELRLPTFAIPPGANVHPATFSMTFRRQSKHDNHYH